MKLLLAMGTAAAALLAQPTTVRELRLTSGGTQQSQGSITITASQSFTAGDATVVTTDPVYVDVINGAFTVDLEPTPAGTFYAAKWQLGGAPYTERWFVRASATPLALVDVRAGTQWLPMAWRGAWSPSVKYAAYDMVSWSGSSYIAIAESTNVLPSNLANWNLMAAQGPGGGTIGPLSWGQLLTGGVTWGALLLGN